MSSDRLARIVRIGRRVDPLILNALKKTPSKEFASSLDYHFKAGGKRMRAALVVLSCAAAGGTIENAINPAVVVEMIHNYSLVMDDLIDRADLRRRRPTVRAVLGDSVALLVAMFYREVLDDIIQDCVAKEKIRSLAVNAMKEIIDGERMDLLFEQSGRMDPYLISNRITNPSFVLYLDMVGKKTASLFKAAAEIGGLTAVADPTVVRALGVFGWKAGLAFQVMDDVLDICGTNTGKQPAKDIIEHKLGNAALLVSMKFLSRKARSDLVGILRSEKVSLKMALKARSIVMGTPSEVICREIAIRYLTDAKRHLSCLKDSNYKDDLVTLSDEIVLRSY